MTDKQKSKETNYSSKNIKNLQYPESIQHNPTMYIGSTDEYGLFQLLKEVGDNVVDEALEGRASQAYIYLNKDGSYTVCDNGNGIPVAPVKIKEPITGKVISMPAVQAVCSIPHTSGKFDDTAYKVSRGVHGLGIKCTNALSDSFVVTTFNDGGWHEISFANGRLKTALRKVSAPLNPATGKKMVKGTCIVYKPSTKTFGKAKLPSAHLLSWAEIAAYFTPGLHVTLASSKTTKEFFFPNGTLDYINSRLKKLEATALGTPFTYTTALCDITLSFTDYPNMDLRSFTNGSPNVSGGEHLNSTFKALYTVLATYAKKNQVFTNTDIKDGLIGLVNAKLSSPEFSSQTKERLTDSRVKAPLADALTTALTKFFTKNKALALQLIEKATRINSLKASFSKSKKLVSSLKALKSKGMPIKYVPPNKTTKPEDREVILIEGDSAGGTAKSARLPFQGILPLKGKVANALRAKKDSALESEEVINILGAIGFDPKSDNPYEKLQVGKIIFLADPDPDGAHINTLLLALFYRYLPELFTRGMIYVAHSPEFYTIYKGSVYTGTGAQSLRSKLSKSGVPNSVAIHHIKGWGEISANLLGILALNPASRTLIQINPLESSDSDFKLLMADDVDFRKKLLGLA